MMYNLLFCKENNTLILYDLTKNKILKLSKYNLE